MGKSTLLTRLALEYARDGFPVLKVPLRALATRMKREGCSLEEGLFALGLYGSGLSPVAAQHAMVADWVVLCDGLDECGTMQEIVAQGLRDFTIGHPHCRLMVTTRPIGYATGLLADWRHYDLETLRPDHADAHLLNLLAEIDPARFTKDSMTIRSLRHQLDEGRIKEVVARSPMLMGLAASLVANGHPLDKTRVQLYQSIFQLIDKLLSDRKPDAPPTPAILRAFLDRLGWELTIQPLRSTDILLMHCAEQLGFALAPIPLT
jgi:hypothetical protein